uniref:Uncharacterized protein n=1 Tax=Arundo donax TaxID=35708 RepID=A0A0A8YKW9_ARUDO
MKCKAMLPLFPQFQA